MPHLLNKKAMRFNSLLTSPIFHAVAKKPAKTEKQHATSTTPAPVQATPVVVATSTHPVPPPAAHTATTSAATSSAPVAATTVGGKQSSAQTRTLSTSVGVVSAPEHSTLLNPYAGAGGLTPVGTASLVLGAAVMASLGLLFVRGETLGNSYERLVRFIGVKAPPRAVRSRHA